MTTFTLKRPWPTPADNESAQACTCTEYPHSMECGMPSLYEFTGDIKHANTLLIPVQRLRNGRREPMTSEMRGLLILDTYGLAAVAEQPACVLAAFEKGILAAEAEHGILPA